jgi:hypothetical protein
MDSPSQNQPTTNDTHHTMFDKNESTLSDRNRTILEFTTAGILGSLTLVGTAAAEPSAVIPLVSNGGFCGGTIETVVNSLLQLALYGGFAMSIFGYIGANAIIGIPGIDENQEERLKQMQSSSIRRGVKIFAVPVLVVALNEVTNGALPIADCLNVTPWL